MHCLHPEAFLLVPLLAVVLRGRLWPRPLLGALRVGVLLAIAALLAQPGHGAAADGRDVVLVVDRSRSMPAESLATARELGAAIAAKLEPGDRIGVVVFGAGAAVVSPPAETLVWPETAAAIDPDGSDLGAGIAAGLALVPPGRQGSLVVVSDGEATRDALPAARFARRRGVRIDVLPVPRTIGPDAAVVDVELPAQVAAEAPFAVNATVVAAVAGPAEWRLVVDGDVRARGTVVLAAGRNLVQLRERLRDPGEHLVAVEIALAGDAVAQNDRAEAVVRVGAKARLLCVTPGGREDRLTNALRAAGLEPVVAAPELAPLTLAALDGFTAVVLENVPAGALPPGALSALGTWVRDLGGGLLMTGGSHSFGVGGYHRSPVEDVLPVTMEIREEQRRFGLALALALDRSGSMRAEVSGTTKMQLADRGAASAIELLSPIDAVALLAVDVEAHVVHALGPAEDKDALGALARSIESAGGGIYIGAALAAAAEQLRAATQESRHIVLFADADDSEQPGDYRTFVPALVADGISVSVIGLGGAGSRDAQLLEEIAALGNGRCQFVADATDLPRVFAQETIQVARSSSVETPTDVVVEPALALLGDMPKAVPPLGGYSVAWQKELAELGLSSADEHAAPLCAHWQCGLGRSAAFLGECDGAATGAWREWDGYGGFFATLVRWLGGGPAQGLFVAAHRDGDVGVYTFEVEPGSEALLDAAYGVATGPDGRSAPLPLEREAPGRAVARLPLAASGVHRAALRFGDDTVRLPPLCRPYCAEWALQLDPRAGERTLQRLARATDGFTAPSVAEVLSGPRLGRGSRDLGPWCVLLALCLLVAEIAVRRLSVHVALRRRAAVPGTPAPAGAAASPPASAVPSPGDRVPGDRAPGGDDLLRALARAQRRGQRRV